MYDGTTAGAASGCTAAAASSPLGTAATAVARVAVRPYVVLGPPSRDDKGNKEQNEEKSRENLTFVRNGGMSQIGRLLEGGREGGDGTSLSENPTIKTPQKERKTHTLRSGTAISCVGDRGGGDTTKPRNYCRRHRRHLQRVVLVGPRHAADVLCRWRVLSELLEQHGRRGSVGEEEPGRSLHELHHQLAVRGRERRRNNERKSDDGRESGQEQDDDGKSDFFFLSAKGSRCG